MPSCFLGELVLAGNGSQMMMMSLPHKNNHTDSPREKIKNFRISQRIMMMLIAINILSFLVSDSCADNKFDFDLAPFAFSGEHSSGMIELLMARLGRDPFLCQTAVLITSSILCGE